MIFLISFIIINIFFITFIKAEIIKSSVRLDLDKTSLIFPLAFVSTLGIIGVVSNTSYYLNIPTESNILLIYTLAFISIPFIWKRKILLKIRIKRIQLTIIEKTLLIIILYMGLLYIHRAFAPWSDQDEISTYGYQTKLIANGFTFNDKIVQGKPIFAQSLFAYFYYISETTIVPKLFKVLGLFFVAQLLYFLVVHLTKKRTLGLASSLLLLVTPELSYIASSLKTDNVLMVFEATSLLCLIYLYYERNNIEAKLFKKFSIITVIFSVIAFSVRFSGAYSLLLISTTIFYLLMRKNYKEAMSLVLITSAISSILLLNFWINLSLYNNPFYPLGGFWTEIIPNSLSQDSGIMSHMQSLYNIKLGNIILEYLYVPIYISVGFGTTLFDWIPWIAHPLHKGVSLGWSNPIIAYMFLIILLSIENKKLLFLSFCYMTLYTFWFSGIQYTRVFLGTTVLAIVLYIVAMDYEFENTWFIITKKVSIIFLVSIFIIFPIYHSLYTFIRMPNGFLSGISANDQYISNLEYSRFMSESLGIYDEHDFPLDLKQIQQVDDVLAKINKPIILTSIEGYPHMYFKYGLFTKDKSAKYHCVLNSKSYMNKLEANFHNVVDFNQYSLWCK